MEPTKPEKAHASVSIMSRGLSRVQTNPRSDRWYRTRSSWVTRFWMTGQNLESSSRSWISRLSQTLGRLGVWGQGKYSDCGGGELVHTSMFRVVPSTPPISAELHIDPTSTWRHHTDTG